MPRVPDRPSPRRYFGVGFLVVLAAALATFFLEDRPGLSQLVNLNLDSWLLSEPGAAKDDVVVVSITDQDYLEQFNATSPLDQEKVQQLIEAIALSGASVIGVDLDTAGWKKEPPRAVDGPPVIWARDVSDNDMQPVLGGDGAGVRFGCPIYKPDSDGVIRRSTLEFMTSKGACPTLAASIADEARHRTPIRDVPRKNETEDEGKLINFAGGSSAFKHLSIKGLVKVAPSPAWRAGNPLKNRIVLLGGSYRAAQDRHLTPVGNLDGVDILAHAVSTELRGNDVKEAKFWGVALDLLVGMALVTAAWSLRRPWHMYVVLALCFVAVFGGSWLVFRVFNLFVSFVPVVAGVVLHEVVDMRIEYGEAVEERDRLERELEAAQSKEVGQG